jgi:hypothetical protein
MSLVWDVFVEGFRQEVERTVHNRAEVLRLRLHPIINTSLYWELHQMPSGAILGLPRGLLQFRVLTRQEWDEKVDKLPPEYKDALLPIVDDLLASEDVKWIKCDCGKGYALLVRKNKSCYRCLRTLTPQQRLHRKKKQARKTQVRDLQTSPGAL